MCNWRVCWNDQGYPHDVTQQTATARPTDATGKPDVLQTHLFL